MFHITTANLNGIRSAATKGFFDWLDQQTIDVLGVQEIKAQADVVTQDFAQAGPLKGHFHYAEKKGYSGVGLYSRHEPSDVVIGMDSAEFDAEGRWVELRFDTPARRLSIISAYFPSGSSGDDRQQAKFRFLAEMAPRLKALQREREFILMGDLNIAHKPLDLKNWKGNLKNSGFLPEERAWLDELFGPTGLVDVYRRLHPEVGEEAYTWWSNRGQAYAKNVGWRLDYQIATHALAEQARTAAIYKAEKFSDHAPLTVGYEFSI